MAIRLLPLEVSAKIAAGEVIERPSSVVKELLENSLDAEATEISVEIRAGGTERVRITDNGAGMDSEDVELAFQRFATSKVSDVHDLEGISTLGFRGEALPSIAAVSAVSLVTRSRDEEFGTRIDLAEGRVLTKEPQGASPGTSVTVSRLFSNFPARRKFLRSTATETSRVQTLVTRYALAYPEVRFRLDVEGRTAFSSGGSGDLREAISSVYGIEIAQTMLELSGPQGTAEESQPRVWGMISPPGLNRANRSYTSLFVNRRWVQSRMMGYAVEQAYHGFLMERRFPIAVVNVAISHPEVDVNVHPAKTEVRFRHESHIFGALQQSVRHTLTTHAPVPEIKLAPVAESGRATGAHSATFWPTEPFARPLAPSSTSAGQSGGPEPLYPQAATPNKALPALRVLGQVQSAYIAAEGPDGMYLIDQHAAHERVVFERTRADMASRATMVQSLLEPATVELDADRQELLESQPEVIARLGFVVEAFGGHTFLLRGVPGLLSGDDPCQALLNVLDLMAEGGGFESWEERAAYSIACHGAIRAGKSLSTQEMSELTRQLEECDQPNTCPHGRPTMIHLSSSHLEREFGRR